MRNHSYLSLIAFLALATFTASQSHQVDVYFFYSNSCPHCAHEKPFLRNLETQYEWLKVHYLEVSENPENARLFTKMAVECGQNPQGVPTTIVCGQMKTGYAGDETTGQEIKDMIMHCYLTHTNHSNCEDHNQNETQIQIPVLGEIDAKNMSLPLFTLILGGLDGFNPCAFFVLFFLLSLLIHAKSRKRMLLIGSIFVFFSALIYFLFMSAWLNLFLYIGEIKAITTIAGGIALVIAAINIKDYFWFKKGVSLSIPDSAKPGLYKRMRSLVKATHLPSMIFGTIILAIAANTYELLCTAGFPMIYTRVLTLADLTNTQYYLYLALYNTIYVIPLFTIVLMFTLTLGARKLTEEEGQILKLMSGNMMLALGALLVFAPQLLNNLLAAAAVLAAAAAATIIITIATGKCRQKQ